MANEVNGRPGGVNHPEKGSEVKTPEKKSGDTMVGDRGAEHLRGADAYGDTGDQDLGRGGD